ncbi:MAG: flippase-like domain-containing protein [Flavobacteriales bacterium]|nr:flippase-like domain-containing protein [Flavobacteriales bacterium]
MKKALLGGLRILVPLGLGLWLVVYFYRQLDESQRAELFTAFGQAHWGWLGLTVLLGWASHASRAWRWRYLLDHLGHRVGFWNSYHATITGYFMNLLLPRAGEASRAMTLRRTDGVPFERGFGTILAERAVDMVMLLGIAAVTLLLQLDKLDTIQERIVRFRAAREAGQVEPISPWWWALAAAAVVAGIALVLSRPAWRAVLRGVLRGLVDGIASVLGTKHKLPFLLHTFLIWGLYVAMFAVGYQALPETAAVPMAGVMAAFIAGSLGIILVQGGIGVYPAFVALITGIYMAAPEGGGLIRPDALAMGWLLWTVQTVMIIALGGLSLLLVARKSAPPQP